MNLPNRHCPRAFSLVETLLAMTLGVIVLATTGTAIDAIIHAPTSLNEKAKARQIGELVMRKMARELAAAVKIRRVTDNNTTRIEITIPRDLDSETELDIIKYEWPTASGGSPRPLRRGKVDGPAGGGSPGFSGTTYDVVSDCRNFRVTLEWSAVFVDDNGPEEVSRKFTGDSGDPFEQVDFLAVGTVSELVVSVHAVHIKLELAVEDRVYTLHETVHCEAAPHLLVFEP